MYYFSCERYKEDMKTRIIPKWALNLEGKWVANFRNSKFSKGIAFVNGCTIKKEWCKCL